MTSTMPAEEAFDDAFRRVFDEQFRSLFRYLDRLSSDPALAADLAQEAFVRLYRRGSLPRDPRAWLVSVASNLLRDQWRSERRRSSYELRLVAAGTDAAPPAPDEALLAGERRRMVRRALNGLPERDRQVLLLRHEGFSYREIAESLGLSEASIGTFLARAKRAFQTAFQEISGASE